MADEGTEWGGAGEERPERPFTTVSWSELASSDFSGLELPTSPQAPPSPGRVQITAPMGASLEPPGWARAVLAELLPEPGALGDFLEPLAPSERLAALLAAIDPADVDDFSLVEVIAAHKRIEAWSAAKAARAAAVLAERDSLNPTWPSDSPGHTRGESVVGQELSMRLRVSKQAAVKMVACGRAFGGMFEPTGELLDRGLIDYPRAQAIVTTLTKLPAEVAMAAQWEVLDKAPGRTLRQVHQDLDKAVIAIDPDSADQRHITARQKRCVYHPRPLPEGMAMLSARLPAADAIAINLALDASARAAKHAGDTRTLDQLRADSLALMGHTALTLGHIGPHAHQHCPCGCQQSEQNGGETPPTTVAPASPLDEVSSQAHTPVPATADPSRSPAEPPCVTGAPPGAEPPAIGDTPASESQRPVTASRPRRTPSRWTSPRHRQVQRHPLSTSSPRTRLRHTASRQMPPRRR